MRNTFASEITSLADKDKRIVLLSGDIGNRLFDKFKEICPNRFFNCGVAEANMISMAAGMAQCGLRPVAYTITPFITSRCFEQIKIDVCYHNLHVVIVGTGSGLSYAELGPTHHSFEDISLMRVLPNITILCPADIHEARLALRASIDHEGPVYIRLGKKNEPIVHKREPEFVIGKGIVLRSGSDACLLGTGNILPVLVEAAEQIQETGFTVQVIDFHTVKPLDEDMLTSIFSQFPVIITVEEHSLSGGFGSSVAEWLAKQTPGKGRLISMGISDRFFCEAGKQHYARQYFGLTSQKIAETLRTFFLEKEESSGK